MRQSTRDGHSHEEVEDEGMLAEWMREFDAAASRPLQVRLNYAFIGTYKPVLDDARYRSFDTMKEYREWCESALPDWLGYGRI